MRPRVGDHARPGKNGVLQCGDVGVTAEDLGIGGNEIPVQVSKQLVAVEPADHGQDASYLRVGERRVQIFDPRGHRRGVEVISLIDVLGESQPQPQRGETVVDEAAVIVLRYERTAPSWRHHANGVASTKLARDDRARLSHRSSIAPSVICANERAPRPARAAAVAPSMVDGWRRSSRSKSPSTAQILSASLVSGARCWGTSYRRHRKVSPPGTI